MGSLSEAVLYDIKYLLMALILLGLYFIFDRVYTRRLRMIDIVAMMTMVCLSGLRYNVGSDYEEYFLRYNYYIGSWSSIISRTNTEKFFLYVCRLFSNISDSKYGVFWVCALLLYPALIYTARKVTGRPSRVIAIYVFLELYAMSNNIMRQAISAEFIMLGYLAIKNKRRVLGIALYIISTGFHLSAIVGLALIYMARIIQPTRKNLLRSIVIGFMTTILWRPLVNLLARIPVISHYIHYIDQSGHYVVRYGMIAYIIFYFIVAVWLIKDLEDLKKCEENGLFESSGVYDESISFIILSIPLFFIATQVSYFYRLTLYLYPFAIFSLTDLLSYHGSAYRKDVNLRVKIIVALICWLLISNIISLDNTFWQLSFRL